MCVIAQDTLVEGTAAWGVQVERVEVGIMMMTMTIIIITMMMMMVMVERVEVRNIN